MVWNYPIIQPCTNQEKKPSGYPFHKNIEGVDDYRPTYQGFIGRSASEHRNTSKPMQWTLACVLKCGGMLKCPKHGAQVSALCKHALSSKKRRSWNLIGWELPV